MATSKKIYRKKSERVTALNPIILGSMTPPSIAGEAISIDKIRFTTPEEKDLWITLPEKKFRDASNYKGGDKLKGFLEKRKA